MPIPTFKFKNLTRTDLLQFDGVNFVNVPVYAVGKNVMWGPEGVGYNSLIVGDVTKNISLVNHKHTTDDILGLRELINDLGVNSNSGTSIDLSKYLLTSTFIDHLNNIGSAKHVTQAHLDKLNSLNNYWQLDEQGNLYTTYNTYSTQGLSAYGFGDEGSGGGYERLDKWADYDSSRAEWVLSAFLGNDLNTRVATIDGRVTDLENSGGSGGSGSVTSVGISVPTGLSVSNSPITSSGVIAIGLQTGYSIPTTAKQGQWNLAYNNSHTHENKTQLDLITQLNIDVLSKLSIVNGNLQINGNAYATGELSAYGAGTGGETGGGGIIETVYGYGNLGQTFNNDILTDTFNAYTINSIHERVQALEAGGGGGSTVAWGAESGGYVPLTVEGVSKSVALTTHTHSEYALTTHNHNGVYETVFSKNTAFNKNFGTTAGTVAQGNDSRIVNGQTAYSWGNHASAGYVLSTHTHTKAQITDFAHTHSAGDITSGTLAIARIPTGTTASTVALGNHLHTDVYEPVFSKNTAFNKDFGTTSGTVARGNDSRINNGQTAYGWGNHASAGYALNSVLSGYVTTSRIITAGNGLTGGGTLAADRTITLATPSTLTAETTNGVTASSHTHAITTTSVGAVNTIVQTDASGGTKLNNLIVGGDWKLEQVGTELQLKYNDVVAQRFLLDGSIVGLGEITAYGASAGGEGVALLRTGGTMTGNLTMSADIIMNSGKAIGVSNLPLKLLGNALTYNASNVLTEANTANKIEMGNGWTIEQTVDSLTIRKDGVIKQTIPA